MKLDVILFLGENMKVMNDMQMLRRLGKMALFLAVDTSGSVELEVINLPEENKYNMIY